jgi:hypothetical protein
MAGGGELAYSVDGAAQKAASEPVVINPDAARSRAGVRGEERGRAAGLAAGHRARRAEGPAARRGVRPGASSAATTPLDGKKPISPRCARTTGWWSRSTASTPAAAITRCAARPAVGRFRDRIGGEQRDGEELPVPLGDHQHPHRRGARRPFFAALDLGRKPYRSWWESDEEFKNRNSYHVAYVVRAVTPGSFALPAVNVSDMYAPRIYGRTAMGHVTIAPR